jgi:hypothetical protein
MQRFTLATAAALAGLFSVAAQAADTSSVQRGDRMTVCPAARDALPEALASAWQFGRAAEVRVAFVVEAGRVTRVQAQGGPADYRRRVAAALRELSCGAPGEAAGEAKAVTMTVRFA